MHQHDAEGSKRKQVMNLLLRNEHEGARQYPP